MTGPEAQMAYATQGPKEPTEKYVTLIQHNIFGF